MWQKLEFILLADKHFCPLDGMIDLLTKAVCDDLKTLLTKTAHSCSQICFPLIRRQREGQFCPCSGPGASLSVSHNLQIQQFVIVSKHPDV